MTFWQSPVAYLTQALRGLLEGTGMSALAVALIMDLIGSVLLVGGALLVVIFLIWLERKILARIQDRLGPNRVGPFGVFQTFADLVKIVTKELITPEGADKVPYNLAPILSVGAVFLLWAVIPLSATVVGLDISVGALYLLAVGSLGVLGMILAGWGSHSKFSLLGGFRAAAQLLSYEIPMALSLLIPVMLAGSMRLNAIALSQPVWGIVYAPIPALIFFVTSIAEVGRAPFDLMEAESELIAGFNIEYSGIKFGFFYVADFLHAFTTAMLFSVLFLGGWQGPAAQQIPVLGFVYFVIKTSVVYLFSVLVRATLPRLRIDQMMNLNWKFFTPLSIGMVMLTALLGKLLPVNPGWAQPVGMLAANLVVGALAWRYAERAESRPRPEVAPANPPFAHWLPPASGGQEGGQA